MRLHPNIDPKTRAGAPVAPPSAARVHLQPAGAPIRNRKSEIVNPKSSPAFTLIELLVVIAIIGVLAAIGLPAMRGMTRSNAITAANRQFLDDLALARQTAIAGHTTVYVVFVPTNVTSVSTNTIGPPLYKELTNLYTAQYNTYALLAVRQVGEQPGRATPKYLTGWRTLPNGVFIAPAKFTASYPPAGAGFYLVGNLPFPVATNFPPVLRLPCITFNYLGQLASPFPNPGNPQPGGTLDNDEYIPLARGSIFYDPNFIPDFQENPPGNSVNNSNVIYINALTGRAKVLQPQLQ
jgi:prepilin-type N-terminal cleavage/methylation domain-containing protein